ncbi:MAG TPA: hydrogen gas-evolving membrane-bound hydrogenase subunit E, partial [Thermodesulfobacteriota bacterium]
MAGGHRQMDLYLVVAAPFVAAALVALLGRRLGRALPLLPIAVSLGLSVDLLRRLPGVMAGEAAAVAVAWAPSLGVSLAFRLDALALLLALLVTAIGALVLWYADGYLSPDEDRPAFFLYMTLFLGAMLGLVLADDLVVLFLFWELTTYASFLLIGFHHRQAEARRAAVTALLVTAAGGLALLAAAAWLATLTGTLRLSGLPAAVAALGDHAARPGIVLLVLLAAATKSAQVPFHAWLPAAMAAPTPVSAYLHSATMVNGGVYLLARFAPALGGDPWWTPAVTATGLASMVVGGYLALRDDDAKRLLAHSTVSQLGMMAALTGLATPLALSAAAFHLFTHATFKATLFMTAGAVDHAAGSRRLSEVGGLARVLPVAAAAAAVAGLALAGVPPGNGYFSKENVLAALEEGPWPGLTLAAAAAGSLASALYTARYWFGTFAGERPEAPRGPHPPPLALDLPVAILALVVLVSGLAPSGAARLAEAAGRSLTGEGGPLHLAPTWGPALWVTLGVYAAAALLLVTSWGRLARLPAPRWSTGGLLEGLGAWTVCVGRRLTEAYETRGLPAYLLCVAAFLACLAWWGTLWAWPPGDLAPGAVPPYAPLLAGLSVGGAAVTLRSRRRLTLLLSLSAVGVSVVLLFVVLRAPDLALTQFLVDSLSLVLILLVLGRTPVIEPDPTGPTRRGVEAVVAAAVGAGVLGIGLVAYGTPRFPSISAWMLERSEPATGGVNVVNAIVVDFRSLDTLGEITVFGMA